MELSNISKLLTTHSNISFIIVFQELSSTKEVWEKLLSIPLINHITPHLLSPSPPAFNLSQHQDLFK